MMNYQERQLKVADWQLRSPESQAVPVQALSAVHTSKRLIMIFLTPNTSCRDVFMFALIPR